MKNLGTGTKKVTEAVTVTEYIRQYLEQLDAQRFAYIKNDTGEVVSEREYKDEERITLFGC